MTPPFSRGDYYEHAKIQWWILNVFFSRSTEPISTKLGTNHPWLKGYQVCSNEGPAFIQVCLNEGPALFQGEIITKYQTYIDKFKKCSFPKPLDQFYLNLAQIILGEGDSTFSNKGPRLFSSRDNYKIIKKSIDEFEKSSSPEPVCKFQLNLVRNILGWRGFKFDQMKGAVPFKGGIFTYCKSQWQFLKIFFFKTTGSI